MLATRSSVLFALPLLLLGCSKPEAASNGAGGGRPGAAASPGGPHVTATGSVIDGAPVDGVPALVADMRPDFLRCYASALEKDAKTAGSVRMTLDLGSAGAIGSLSTAASKGIGKELASCLDARVRKAKFGTPKGPLSTVLITVDLSP